jgi:hypothetical protein
MSRQIERWKADSLVNFSAPRKSWTPVVWSCGSQGGQQQTDLTYRKLDRPRNGQHWSPPRTESQNRKISFQKAVKLVMGFFRFSFLLSHSFLHLSMMSLTQWLWTYLYIRSYWGQTVIPTWKIAALSEKYKHFTKEVSVLFCFYGIR